MRLIARFGAAFGLCLAMWAGPSVASEPLPALSETDGYTDRLATLINDYRRAHGLGPLSFAVELASLASEHTERMVSVRQLSHEGFRDRSQRTGSRVCVENVGRGFPSAETLLNGWRRSQSHHVNLLDPKVSRMGIAASARFVTFFACS